MCSRENLSPSKSEIKKKYFHFIIYNLPYEFTREMLEEILLREVGSFYCIKMNYSNATKHGSSASLYFDTEESYRIAHQKVIRLKINGRRLFAVEECESPKVGDGRSCYNMKSLSPDLKRLMLGGRTGSIRVKDEGKADTSDVKSDQVEGSPDLERLMLGGRTGIRVKDEGKAGTSDVKSDQVEGCIIDIKSESLDNVSEPQEKEHKVQFQLASSSDDDD